RVTGSSPTRTRAAALKSEPKGLATLELVELAACDVRGISFRGAYEDEITAFEELTGYAYADTALNRISDRRRSVDGITLLHHGWHSSKPSERTAVMRAELPGRYDRHTLPGGLHVAFDCQGSLEQAGALLTNIDQRISREFNLKM